MLDFAMMDFIQNVSTFAEGFGNIIGFGEATNGALKNTVLCGWKQASLLFTGIYNSLLGPVAVQDLHPVQAFGSLHPTTEYLTGCEGGFAFYDIDASKVLNDLIARDGLFPPCCPE